MVEYGWKRFLFKRGKKYLLGEDGFLLDPDTEYGRFYGQDLLSLEQVQDTQCMILLGEPGIGKSRVLREMYEISPQLGAEDLSGSSEFIDLRSYGAETRLVEAIFKSPKAQKWQSGNKTHHLFLDSLDEALIRVETLASILIDELVGFPQDVLDRLNLRIACRSGAWAQWSSFLEEGLRKLWPDKKTEIRSEDSASQFLEELDIRRTGSTPGIRFERTVLYEIAPLRREDVELAATANGLDPEAFMSSLESRRVTTLAQVPITLELLFNVARSGETLPRRRWELYRHGCLALCKENSLHRRSSLLRGNLTADQRLEVAGLLAALTVFSNRTSIVIEPQSISGDGEALNLLAVLNLVQGSECSSAAVTRESLEEILQNTSLFTAIGQDLYGWAHRTYTEFLAAWYLSRQLITERQKLSLIESADGYVVPQLSETTMWLCCKSNAVLKSVLENDPQVALHSDPASARDVAPALVDSLLAKLRTRSIDRVPISPRSKYPILEHDQLAAQLLAYISNDKEDWLVRRTAMDIGEVCRATEIADALRDIVLDCKVPAALRSHAVLTIAKLGDADHLQEIAILLDMPISDDEDSELLGSLLHVLWPEVISIEKVVSHLAIPEGDHVFGMFRHFLDHTLVDKISPGDVAHLLDWLASAPIGRRALQLYGALARKTVTMAFRQLDDLKVVRLLAVALRHIERRLEQAVDPNDEKPIGEYLAANDEFRHNLLREYLKCAAKVGDISFYFPRICSPRIYLSSDQAWLLNHLAGVPESERETWNHFVRAVYDFEQPNALDNLFDCFNKVPSLKKKFEHAFEALELDSEAARRLREENHDIKTNRRGRGATRPIDPSPQERIRTRLAEFERGELGAWWRLLEELALEDYSTHYSCVMNSDVRELPGWEAALPEIRNRVISAAKVYVEKHRVNDRRNFGTNTFYKDDMSGYQALVLLIHEEPIFVRNISSTVWENWCPAIIGFPLTTTVSELDASKEVFRLAYENAPSVFLGSLEKILGELLESDRHISTIHSLEEIVDRPISCIFLKYAQDETYKAERRGELLRVGLFVQHEQTIDYAIELVCQGRGEVRYDEMRAEAAASLMLHKDDACWNFVWPIFKYDFPCALHVLYRYVELLRYAGKRYHLPNISPEEFCDLYIWLAEWFPHQLDPDRKNDHWLSPRDQVLDFRRGILSYLKGLGTPQSIGLLRSIHKCLPEVDWMKWTIAEAERVVRQKSWQPLRPDELLTLLKDPKKRVVESETQLQELVVESLQRYQNKLRGEISLWYRLWDKQSGSNSYRPKEEERLSDDLAEFLREDLERSQVVVNREVQIHSRSQHSSDRTDIHVDAFRHQLNGTIGDRVAVIVEVKGSWNPNLLTNMEKQLVQQYLHDNACQHGIYVTGWHVCGLWDESDSRKKVAMRHGDIESLRERLDRQANELSKGEDTLRSVVIDCSIPEKND